MKTCMFLCFCVNLKHESTKTCMFPCNFHDIIRVKGLFFHFVMEQACMAAQFAVSV